MTRIGMRSAAQPSHDRILSGTVGMLILEQCPLLVKGEEFVIKNMSFCVPSYGQCNNSESLVLIHTVVSTRTIEV